MFSGCVNLSGRRCREHLFPNTHKPYPSDLPFKTPGKCALSGAEAKAKGDIKTRVNGLAKAVAAWTAHVALEQTTKSAVHNAVAFEEG